MQFVKQFVIIARSAFASKDRNEREQWIVWTGPRRAFHSLEGAVLTKEEAEHWAKYFPADREPQIVPVEAAETLIRLLRG